MLAVVRLMLQLLFLFESLLCLLVMLAACVFEFPVSALKLVGCLVNMLPLFVLVAYFTFILFCVLSLL